MEIPIYQIDAFTGQLFAGNPAAVCPLPVWLPDELMQAIAAENNLSETAFIVGHADGRYAIRWMTPAVEVDLCGHATLASAQVVFEHLEPGRASVTFDSRSGPLAVARQGELLCLDFPSMSAQPCPTPPELAGALGHLPAQTFLSRDYLAVFESEAKVRALSPDFTRIKALAGVQGVIVTAPGDKVDFVSRYFVPQTGIDEDPVTGSAHCALTPYWARRLGKTRLHALQVSKRGGELFCEDRGERVSISGRAVQYLEGSIRVDRL